MPKISELDAAAAPDGTEDVPLVQGTSTVRTTVSELVRGGMAASGDIDCGGNTFTSADMEMDPTGLKVLTSTSLSEMAGQADAAFLRVGTTGATYGGFPTTDGSTMSFTAGQGGIVDNSDPTDPTYTPVTWVAKGPLTPPEGTSYYYIDAAGDIFNDSSDPTPSQRRTRIYLARVSVTGGVVTGFTAIHQPTQQLGPQIRDIMEAVGPVRMDTGLHVEPASTDLTLTLIGGRLLSAGVGGATIDPHTSVIASADPLTWRMATQSGVVASDVTTLDVGNYDAAGVVTAIPGAISRATIFSVYMFPSGNVRIFYGQTWYDSIADAQAALPTREFTIPAGFRNALCIEWIIARKDATDLSDSAQALFLHSTRFGTIGGVRYA